MKKFEESKGLLIFGGTTEGRELLEFCHRNGILAYGSVATEYGHQLLLEDSKIALKGGQIEVVEGRMNRVEIEEFLEEKKISLVIDATHPFAVEVTKNIGDACQNTHTEYLRCERSKDAACSEKIEEQGDETNLLYVDSVNAAATYLAGTTGRVLLATGSKELEQYAAVLDQSRLYPRILPNAMAITKCLELDYPNQNLICMQGPFTEELNYALLRQIRADYFVTKESGDAGGFTEKVHAAKRAGAMLIVIGRPKESGYSPEAILHILGKRYSLEAKKKITIVGMGMGTLYGMTIEAELACKQADAIFGSARILEVISDWNKNTFAVYQEDKIEAVLNEHPEYHNVVILMSGDIGFYSGARKLAEGMLRKNKEIEVHRISGISSFVYFLNRLNFAWENVKCLSLHGREENVMGAIHTHEKVFLLLGGENGVSDLCAKLEKYGLSDVKMWVGERLSYPDEKITTGSPIELKAQSFKALSVALVENENAASFIVTHGLPDSDFIRGNVPMTKSEIRSISLSKLQLNKNSVLYDIGAGTGSVAVEAARLMTDGRVYAIDKNREAISLIEANRSEHGLEQLHIIEGMAPDELETLPMPTHAFIGGSSGNLKEIIQTLLNKNPKIRIVINAIALETVGNSLQVLGEFAVDDADIVQISVAKAKSVAKLHMMMGQNPVYIISFGGERV